MNYTSETNIQILIKQLKYRGVRKVVASPGSMNISFVGSIQNDTYFEMYSVPDERSAAYFACGLAKESREVVVITCTGATASRNYLPGLTEAFYEKLPILVITCTQSFNLIGQNIPQVLDRSSKPKDAVVYTCKIPVIRSEEDLWHTNLVINEALATFTSNDVGPVHIDIVSECRRDFNVKEIPDFRYIQTYYRGDQYPKIDAKSVGIFVGEHNEWSKGLEEAVIGFCERYNGVVFCDWTSNYFGKYSVFPSLVCSQDYYVSDLRNIDLLIYIGNISGTEIKIIPQNVWRVNPDGRYRDPFKQLSCVFKTTEEEFFNSYCEKSEIGKGGNIKIDYYSSWISECDRIEKLIPELPFSNAWAAKTILERININCNMHFGILNSLRCWSFFCKDKHIVGHSNTGGFGIDGCISTLVGASMVNPDKLYFGIIGDLAFYYDINILFNRHLSNNVRILLINNEKGAEFKMYNHVASVFGDDADRFIAAGGHNSSKSQGLVTLLANEMGFKYLSADNKKDFLRLLPEFISEFKKENDKPIIFEIFTEDKQESEALRLLRNIIVDDTLRNKELIKIKLKDVLGNNRIKAIKSFFKG